MSDRRLVLHHIRMGSAYNGPVRPKLLRLFRRYAFREPTEKEVTEFGKLTDEVRIINAIVEISERESGRVVVASHPLQQTG